MVLVLYLLILGLFSVYSYALVDPNFTLVNHGVWEYFRNYMVNLGYYQRELSTGIFFILIGCLVFFNWYFWHRGKYSALKLAIIIAGVTLFSYPFLSHDFFNYLFDAKILTFYGQNPYLHKALDFPSDSWLRFMHWTHRTYPYGPVFLILTLVPSFLSFGKLVLAFLFFKLLFAAFYIGSVWVLSKFDQKTALFFTTSPLVIVEGLVNNHNDLLGVSLMLLALYFSIKKHNLIKAGIFGLTSLGIKYVTLAALPLFLKTKSKVWLSLGLWIALFAYVYFKLGIHPWYLLNLMVLLPFFKAYALGFMVLSTGLLVSYYPYLYFGGWDEAWKVSLKEQIIFLSLLLFVLLLWLNNQKTVRWLKTKPRQL